MSELTHLNANHEINMVDVSNKPLSARSATATGRISMNTSAFTTVLDATSKKGDVLTTAKIAGIQGAKQCAQLIPLCHPLALQKVDVMIEPQLDTQSWHVTCTCKVLGNTGVEIEALTGVQVALLTMFDMVKALDPNMTIGDVKVIQKTGGKSGHWERQSG